MCSEIRTLDVPGNSASSTVDKGDHDILQDTQKQTEFHPY